MSQPVRKRILLVEDEAILAMTEKMQLEKYGYAVRTAMTGEQAVEIARTSSDIDLILMDINLGPGIDGTQAAQQILNHKDIPVVFLSSHTEPEIVAKTETITSYGYVVKNSSLTVLDASIKMALKLFEAKQAHSLKELALQQSENRFHELFEKAPLGYQSLDGEGRFLEVNQAWVETLGYDREEVIGKWFGDFLAPEYVSAFRERFPAFLAQGHIHSEFYMRHKNGNRVYIAFDGRVGFDENGCFKQTHCILKDETERKEAEEALRKSEAIKNAIVSNIGDVIVIIDGHGINQYKSRNVTALFGWTPEELIGRNTWENVHPHDLEAGQRFFGTILRTPGATGKTELRYKRKDGSYVWIEISVVNLLHDPDIQGVLGNYHEISERKQAEEQLEQSRQRLRQVIDLIPHFVFAKDVDGKYLLANAAIAEVYGTTTANLLGKSDYDFTVNREETDFFIACDRQVIESGKGLFGIEESMTDSTGALRHFETTKIPFTASGTEKPAILAVAVDVTDRKRAEDSLRTTIYELKKSQEVARVGSWVWRVAENSVEWSDEMYRIFGIDRASFTGDLSQVITNCIHPDDRAEVYRSNLSVMERNTPIPVEYRVLRPDGSVRTVWAEAGELELDEAGKPRLLRGIVRDITERKDAEREIQKQLAEKEILLREVHHRVKNNIANVEGLLSLQADSSVNLEVQTALRDAVSRVQSMRVLYEKLLLSKDTAEISLKTYLDALIDSLVAALCPEQQVIVEKSIADFEVDAKKAFFVGIIVNELLTNAFKYAFTGREDGTVSVSVDKEARAVTLTVRDNGSGFDERAMLNTSPGFGRTIIRMLVEQLGGSLSTVNDHGAKTIVRFEL